MRQEAASGLRMRVSGCWRRPLVPRVGEMPPPCGEGFCIKLLGGAGAGRGDWLVGEVVAAFTSGNPGGFW